MRFLIFIFLCFTLEAKIVEVKQLFNFSTVEVKKEISAQTHIYYGKTTVDESRVFDISLRFDAFVTKLIANKSYMKIKKGDILFKLYSKEVISVLQELHLAKHISKQARDNALLKLKFLDLSKLQNLKNISNDFAYFSPYDGYIVSKDIDEGSFVKRGKRVMQIADFSTIWVKANIYQKDAFLIQKGMNVEVKIDGFDLVSGVVDFVYPMINTKDQTIPVRIVIKNNKDLFPGLFAKIKITTSNKGRLVLPKTAIIQKGDKSYVFLPQNDGTFLPKEISTQQISSKYYEVSKGLKEGEKVVSKALFLLDSDALSNGLYDEGEDDDW